MRCWRKIMEVNQKQAFFASLAVIAETVNRKVSLVLMKAFRQIGHYDSVVFSDKLIHAVIQDMGGWIALCQHNEKELSFVQRDFERRYQIYCRRRPKILPKHLTGFIAHQNAINGHEKSIPPAVVFSETRKTIKNKSLIMGN